MKSFPRLVDTGSSKSVLHLLVSEVRGFEHISMSLDRNRFKLHYYQELITVKPNVSLNF
jgi:hypothetical protein